MIQNFNLRKWVFLIHTQINEILEHEESGNRFKCANEFADMVSIAAQAIEELGYDSEKIMETRRINIVSRIPQIVKKYAIMWAEVNSERENQGL